MFIDEELNLLYHHEGLHTECGPEVLPDPGSLADINQAVPAPTSVKPASALGYRTQQCKEGRSTRTDRVSSLDSFLPHVFR